jgi:hypothetical protein
MNSDRAKNDSTFFAERGFGLRIGFGLIVIDMLGAGIVQ